MIDPCKNGSRPLQKTTGYPCVKGRTPLRNSQGSYKKEILKRINRIFGNQFGNCCKVGGMEIVGQWLVSLAPVFASRRSGAFGLGVGR